MFMKPKITLLLLFILIGFNNVFSQTTPQHPDLRTCGSAPNFYEDYFNCTSNNYTLDQVFLSLTNVNGVPLSNTTCTPGVTPDQQMYVMLNYTSNSNSLITQVRIFADLSIDGVVTPINVYLPNGVAPGAGQRQIFGPFTWKCGQELSLCRILVVWKVNGGPNDPEDVSYDCNTYSKSQCEFGGCMLVAAPLAVQFDYTVCTVGNQSAVTFQNTTTGGVAPYTFLWDFGDGQTSTQQPPPPVTHNYPYPGGPYTVTLTVTDSNVPTPLVSTYTQVITPPAPISINGNVTSANCSNGNGSIEATPSGGTPPYSYSWSAGGSTSSNSGQLPPGSYTVTVTDSVGCSNSQSFTILPGDTTPPTASNPPSITLTGCNGTFPDPDVSVVTDESDNAGAPIVTYVGQSQPSLVGCIETIVRTYKVADACGNFINVTQNLIRTVDTTPPSITAAGANAAINCPDAPVFTAPTASDACGSATINLISDVTTPGACAGTYVRTKTWDASDVCGNNSAPVSQSITVQDITPPSISAAGANATINCPAVPVFTPPTGSDSCGIVTINLISDVTTPGACAGAYIRTKTWDASDACGNHSAPVSQSITVQDNTPPSISAAGANATINCPAVPVFTPPTGSDSCGIVTINLISDVTTPGACAGAYIRTKTWDASDACGNHSAPVSQSITVQDNTPPSISAAGANATINCPAVPVFTPPTGSDSCGIVTINLISDVTTPGACAGTYVRTKTWDASDACGNHSAQVSQAITVQDNTPPSISAAGANATINCPAVPVFTPPTGSDACGIVTINLISDVTTPGACAGAYIRTKTWDASDACGNHSAQVSQTITVQDITPPTPPTPPANVNVSCSGDIPPMISLTANDACSGPISVQGVDVITGGSCSGSFTVTRTWTFVDACQNPSSISQIINVNDSSDPVLPTPPANVTVSCIGEVPPMVSLTANDTCSGQITVPGVDSVVQGNCPNSFIITRTWTFADPCGNSDSVEQIITVNDNIPPVAPSAPANVTVSCGTLIPAMISLTANDACSGEITVQGVDSTVPGNCANSYVITRTWTFVDACGNPSSVSQIINVHDDIAPVAPSAPADIKVSCGTEIPEMISLTANDACSGVITVQGIDSTVPGDCVNSYVITRTWTFIDACGNPSSVSQIITVEDDIAPVAPSAPADVTVSCGSEIPEMISLTANDACSGVITVQGVDSTVPGNCANSYVVTRTWTFVDACGNPSSVSQIINVHDDIAPVAPSAPANVTVACGSEIPEMISLTANDACSGVITVQGVDSTVPGDCANSYVVTRTWTFIDACGNPSSVSQIITVHDDIAPVAPSAPADVTVTCGSLIPAMISLTANDACSGEITVQGVDSITPGNCADSYVVTRTWTFVDACGNPSSVSQVITVHDDIPPVEPVAPADINVSCGTEIPEMISLTANDACSGEITVQGADHVVPGSCLNSYLVIRTWIFTDSCGNSSTVTQNINVNDNIPPISPLPQPDILVNCADQVPPMASLTAYDTCSGDITVPGVDVVTPGDCPNSFTITRTWTFIDFCDNRTIISQLITVKDELPPVLEGQPIAEQDAFCTNIPPKPELQFTDSCGGEVVVVFEEHVENEDAELHTYDIIRTWTATDVCLNVAEFIQIIHVKVEDFFDADNPDLCNNDSAFETFNLMSLLPEGTEPGGQWIGVNVPDNLFNHENNTLNVTQLEVGYYTIQYILTAEQSDCPRKLEFYIHVVDDCNVLAECSIVVYNAVSPNNDGLNDLFTIDGIECYLENNVQIYNRWGLLVFDKDNYDNKIVYFDGKSDARSTMNKNEELPDGTYFYIMKYRDNEHGAWHDKSGYLYLNR
jgi:gliding motility-associated-like protein